MRKVLTVILLLVGLGVWAQDSTAVDSVKNCSQELNGYVKYMTIAQNLPNGLGLYSDNLIHNRLNYKAFVGDKLEINASARNRLFWGESVKLTPNYGDVISNETGLLDMSWTLVDGDAVLNTTIDRLNFKYTNDKFEAIVGRQRVNWGIGMVWNPNDVFNIYSFFDFDYEERPGTDAAVFRYYRTYASQIEVVAAYNQDLESSAVALLYKSNYKGYDIQGIVGYQNEYLVAGTGWSGFVKSLSFRGEGTYFHGQQSGLTNEFVGTVDMDYSFENQTYVQFSYLFNTNGLNARRANYQNTIFSQERSILTLSPSKHTFFVSYMKPITPPLAVTVSAMVNPRDGSFFAGPGVNWTMSDNWSVLLSGQMFIGDTQTAWGGYGQYFFLRFKYSF